MAVGDRGGISPQEETRAMLARALSEVSDFQAACSKILSRGWAFADVPEVLAFKVVVSQLVCLNAALERRIEDFESDEALAGEDGF